VLHLVRRELSAVRSQRVIPPADDLVARIRTCAQNVDASRIRPLINGTGILVHTNFGRAPLGPEVIEAMSTAGANYTNVEYDLATGARGPRASYLEHGLALLCGAEAATIVNNNAAALVLILRHFCRPPVIEVVISRGELVQIGGGFRIPEVLESSGARLREVGTTNQTSLHDYARALNENTALILKVHRSNFFMDGFVASPATEDIAALARRKRIPFVEDLGSGAIVDTQTVTGLDHEPTPSEVLRRGVELVCFSGDKLFGGPQAGLIAGRQRVVGALKREPLYRALRCDKLILSALEATVATGLGAARVTPVLAMMQTPKDDLRLRAERIVEALLRGPLHARIGEGHSQIGGGTLPRSTLASITVDVTHDTLKPLELARRLRNRPLPVVGYIAHGILKLDLRTIFPRQDEALIASLRAASLD
jgi:L-seryl-tRNA(Ser) seleniumtransferase